MVVLKTTREIKIMREAGRISARALQLIGKSIEPGITTAELDKIAYDYIISTGARPNFLNYGGFPATACISINNEVIHGIPDKHRVIHKGDIVSVDIGAEYDGYNGDNAATFACGEVSAEAQRLGTYEFDVPFSRQQLADYLGVERSGLSLELGKMKKDGLLEYHRSHFVLTV